MMKTDKLKQFVALRQSLLNEKGQIEKRLAEIKRALGEDEGPAASAASASSGRKLTGGSRIDNPMSLKEAVRRVTSVKALTKKEILDAIHKIGYRFAAKDPLNSLNVILYTKGNFKNNAGKFSPLK